MIHFNPGHLIIMPTDIRQMIFDHCQRKLDENYLTGEEQERKAFGILAGKNSAEASTITNFFPLLKNARYQDPYNSFMNKLMHEHATPSETPFHKRGWIADPKEYLSIIKQCRLNKIEILGSYHMHRVGWEHDPLRDKTTKVDQILGSESRSFIFIISMVNPSQPIFRAFYEGEASQEATISLA